MKIASSFLSSIFRILGQSLRKNQPRRKIRVFAGFMLFVLMFVAIRTHGIALPVPRGTFPAAINKRGEITGHCVDSIAVAHGFVRDARGKITVFDAPGTGPLQRQGTFATDINDSGVIVGFYIDSNRVHHGFLRDPNGAITTFDAPGAGTGLQPEVLGDPELLSGQGTIATSVNDAETTIGYFFDSKNVQHGFVRDKLGAFVVFDFPGSGDTIPESINNAGQIAGAYYDPPKVIDTPTMHSYSSGAVHCFQRENDGQMHSCDIPGASEGPTQGPWPETINADGVIFGWDQEGNGSRAFIRDVGGHYTTYSFSAPSYEPIESADSETPTACDIEANTSVQLSTPTRTENSAGADLTTLVPGRYRGTICEKVIHGAVLTGRRTERGNKNYRGFIRDTHGGLTVFDVTSEAGAIAITSVTPIVNGVTKTMTIKGRHFGIYPSPTGAFQGLIVFGESGNFNCGDDATPGNDPNSRLQVTRWTDTQLDVTGFSWPSKSVCRYLPGDKVDVGVWNAQTGAGPANFALTVGTTSKDLTPPKITSVTPVYPRADQTFIIRGQGFGSAPKGFDSDYLTIWDDTSTWLSTRKRRDPVPPPPGYGPVTIKIGRWTPNEIVVTGFGGAYGLHQWTLNGGDKIKINVTNPDTGARSAEYETTVVGTGENLVAPVISSVSKISARGDQTITIEGKGFGSRPPTTQADETTPFLMITDETGNWRAGRLGANTMSVFLSVSQWTDTKIVANRFTGAYADERQLRSGDQIKIQVWNAQTDAGPAEYRLTVDGTVSPAVLSGAPYIVEASINPNSSSIQLASGLMYLYGMSNGGARPSQPFMTGQFAEAVNAYHNLAAALAYGESGQNRYPTTTWSHDICGVAVAGRWNRFDPFYGVNAEPGASSAAATFNVVENSFVVIIGLAGGQTDITVSGVPGMQIDRTNKDSGGEIGIVIAHATLAPGSYTITEFSSDTSNADAESKADLIGVFVFGENK